MRYSWAARLPSRARWGVGRVGGTSAGTICWRVGSYVRARSCVRTSMAGVGRCCCRQRRCRDLLADAGYCAGYRTAGEWSRVRSRHGQGGSARRQRPGATRVRGLTVCGESAAAARPRNESPGEGMVRGRESRVWSSNSKMVMRVELPPWLVRRVKLGRPFRLLLDVKITAPKLPSSFDSCRCTRAQWLTPLRVKPPVRAKSARATSRT